MRCACVIVFNSSLAVLDSNFLPARGRLCTRHMHTLRFAVSMAIAITCTCVAHVRVKKYCVRVRVRVYTCTYVRCSVQDVQRRSSSPFLHVCSLAAVPTSESLRRDAGWPPLRACRRNGHVVRLSDLFPRPAPSAADRLLRQPFLHTVPVPLVADVV